ncbi:iron-sulfur flavoprotein [Methanobrevibacter cuticularis]|uniref:Iron-sulfur flavoprotein n=1 Tax=Methanobrevibacter cuticularis TaxID=47311 RepID=A0A166D9C7_9EURY|nr:flavodoxin family protein [Methanobrevibacter cuticularis]KZX15341.1 iron-sulfur flavoprotein [Methanobrevibacter cuticularis]
MKIVGFSGSPRKDGSTNTLIKRILKKVDDDTYESSIYYLNELNINPCQACGYCAENEGCDLDDSMKDLIKELEDSDVVIIGSPIYYGEVSAQTKLFTDRFYSIFNSKTKNLKNKKLILIYTQANPDPKTYTNYIKHQKKFLYEFLEFDVVNTLIAANLHFKEDLLENKDLLGEADNIALRL